MKRFINPTPETWRALTQRGSTSYASLEPLAKKVFDNVAQSGDKALVSFTKKFDKVKLEDISVSKNEIEDAIARVPQNLKNAVQKAKENIFRFHSAQKTKEVIAPKNNPIKNFGLITLI